MLQNLAGRNMKIKEGIMLERIMDLHLLLYTMTALAHWEQWECWPYTLPTEEPCEKQKQ